MATSTVKLYYGTKILADRNMLVEGIEDYLSTLTPTIMEDFQYIRHDLSVEIKFDTSVIGVNVMASNILNPWKDGKINYVSIQNETDEKPIYYYVVDSEWIGKFTLKLYLAMDTLNTFNGAYSFDKKTVVTREHKNRFGDIPYVKNGVYYYPRKFYLDSDGIQPTLYKQSEETVTDSKADYDWYLLYMANNVKETVSGQEYAVNAYVVPSENIKGVSDRFEIKMSDLDTTKEYWFGTLFTDTYNSGVFTLNGNNYTLTEVMFIEKTSQGGYNWSIRKRVYSNGIYSTPLVVKLHNDDKIEFTTQKGLDIINSSDHVNIITGQPSNATVVQRVGTYKTGSQVATEGTGSGDINDIVSVDRTDTKLLGIIKLPYCPISVSVTTSGLVLPEYVTKESITWANGTSGDYLKISSNFLSGFENEISIAKTKFFELFYVNQAQFYDRRNDECESALYRSEYLQERFVYDSFNYTVLNEKMNAHYFQGTEPLKIKMVTTSTMNSRFLFDFNNKNKAFIYQNAEQNYPYIMNVARNNNIITYNSEYVNYMRNGYNYDVKAKNATILSSALGIGSSALQLAATPISPLQNLKQISKTKNALRLVPVFYAGMGEAGIDEELRLQEQLSKQRASNLTASQLAISGAFGAVSSIINGINSIIQTENTFEQKQKQMAQASVSVSGSDDIDLLSYYSGNRMKLETWQCSDRMRKALADLYYYQGYSTNEQKVPELNTRKWFNFIQCEAVLTNDKNLDDKYLDNLKERYAIGVTVMHKVDNSWDWAQEKGNLETFL